MTGCVGRRSCLLLRLVVTSRDVVVTSRGIVMLSLRENILLIVLFVS